MGAAIDLFAGVAALAARVQPLGLALGVPLALVGLAALAAGTRHRRVLAVGALAAIGALAGFLLRALLAAHLGLAPSTATALLGAAGGAAGLLFPAGLPFAVAALPGALAGAALPLGGRAELGAAAGALVAGIVGVLLSRIAAAAAAGLGGGFALALGLLACFGKEALARELAGRPAVVIGFALVAGIAGAALQLAAGPGAPTPGGPAARSPVSQP